MPIPLPPILPIVALDPMNLGELLLWCKLAQEFLEHDRIGAMNAMNNTIAPASAPVPDANMVLTLERLKLFIGGLVEVIAEINTGQAMHELAHLPKDRLN